MFVTLLSWKKSCKKNNYEESKWDICDIFIVEQKVGQKMYDMGE